MSLRITGLVTVACALVLLSAAPVAPQTRVKGRVQTPGDNTLVAREQVMIDGAGQYDTRDHGEFEFDLTGDLKVGQPARFHVYHVNPAIKIQQWIVVSPCDLVNGRKDSLPAAGSEPLSIVVLPKGDQRLKSLNEVSRNIYRCIIEEAASEFRPISRSGGPNRSSLFNGRSSVVAGQVPSRPFYESPITQGFSRFVEATYRIHIREKPSVSSSEGVNDSAVLDQASLARKAAELGFAPQELADALKAWVRSVEDSYQKGLASLYESRFAEATAYISASIPTPPGEFLTRYVPLARVEYIQGHYSAAEAALRKVLAVHSDDPLVLNNLGVVLKAEAKYAEAEPLLKRALEISSQALGPEHPDVAGILGNLADLYRTQRKYAEAEPLYQRALNIHEKTLGPYDPDVATSLNGLALLYHAQRNDAEALRLYNRAVAIDERAVALPHPQDAAITLSNVGDLYRDNKMYSDAEALYERALEIEVKALGPEHPDVAGVMNNWALLYHAEGDDQKAESTYKQALAIAKNAFGREHRFVATILDNLGEVYRTEKRYSEAEPLYKEALAIAEKAEPDLLEAGTYLNHLAVLYHMQTRYAEAEPLYKRALTIDQKCLPADDPDLAVGLGNLALVYKDEGRYGEAEPLLKKALSIQQKVLESDDPALLATLQVLAVTLFHLHRPGEAKVYADQAKLILLDAEGSQAHEKGDEGEAESVYRRALSTAESALGSRDPQVARELSNLAVVLHAQGKDAEAEPMLKRALDIIEENGREDLRVAILADNIAAVLHKLGRDAEAKVYEDRAASIRAKKQK